ncbi:contact-dependent growth inhibition system immunity protein [Streptomyces sp. NPDC001780]
MRHEEMPPCTPERRSRALEAYLRHTWHTRPSAIAEAERQLREYSRNPPGRIRLGLGEFYAVPDTGLPRSEIGDWLMVLADHLKKSIEEGDVPEPSSPQTHWEWHARFPETAQLLGGWFSQDIADEFPDHGAAVADYAATTGPQLVARLVGELHELLALPLDEADYALAAAELGMEVSPPEPVLPRRLVPVTGDDTVRQLIRVATKPNRR